MSISFLKRKKDFSSEKLQQNTLIVNLIEANFENVEDESLSITIYHRQTELLLGLFQLKRAKLDLRGTFPLPITMSG